jgi:hypothetical protein
MSEQKTVLLISNASQTRRRFQLSALSFQLSTPQMRRQLRADS